MKLFLRYKKVRIIDLQNAKKIDESQINCWHNYSQFCIDSIFYIDNTFSQLVVYEHFLLRFLTFFSEWCLVSIFVVVGNWSDETVSFGINFGTEWLLSNHRTDDRFSTLYKPRTTNDDTCDIRPWYELNIVRLVCQFQGC